MKSGRSPSIFFAGLFHESHTFVDDRTGLGDFAVRRGEDLLAAAGDSSPMGGALEFASGAGWEVVPGPDYRAVPGGTAEHEVVEAFREDVREAWDPACDALFVVLHGAMVTDRCRDVEGELLGWFRSLPGAEKLPLFGVYDLHANFSPAMAKRADCLVAYRENPHTDARESGVRAARLLERCLDSGETPRMSLRRTSHLWAPTATGTADEPMRSLEAQARGLENGSNAVWSVNVNAGFAYADTPDTGLSFQVVHAPEADASAALERLAVIADELARHARPRDLPLDEVMPQVRERAGGLTVLVEPSDNIGGGAPGDGTGLLKALIEHRITEAAVCLHDPDSVRLLASGKRRLAIGGKGSRFDEGPLELEVELVSRSDGRFELEDKQSHLASVSGDHFDMGPSAVVRHGGVTILLTSRRTPPFDLGQWRSQGIDPAELNAIAVKAAVAHRRAYDPITARSFTVDTPGPCRSDLSAFPYRFAGSGGG